MDKTSTEVDALLVGIEFEPVLVGIVMGSESDREVMAAAGRELDGFKARANLDDDPSAFADLVADTNWVKLQLEELREGTSRDEARTQLLAWLTQEPEERE